MLALVGQYLEVSYACFSVTWLWNVLEKFEVPTLLNLCFKIELEDDIDLIATNKACQVW